MSLTPGRCAGVGLVVALLLSGGCTLQPTLKANPADIFVDARTTLLKAADDPEPQVRTRALEALAATEQRAAGPVYLQALKDELLPVRFAAAMAIGDSAYAPARPALLNIAKDANTPPKLLVAVIYALHALRDDSYTSELGRLLRDEDKWVQCTAIMVMGRMGEASALGPLRAVQAETHDEVVQLQAVEAMANLGDQRAIVLLEAFTRSHFMEDRLVATETLGKLGGNRAAFVLKGLMEDGRQDPAVRVAAAGSLAKLGDMSGYDMALEAAAKPDQTLRRARGRTADIRSPEVVNLQTLAVLALGKMGNINAAEVISPLLRSPNGTVRVAAAKALLQLLRPFQPAGLAAQREPALTSPQPLPGLETTRPAPMRPTVRPAAASGPATAPAGDPELRPVMPPAGEARPAPADLPGPELVPATRPATIPMHTVGPKE